MDTKFRSFVVTCALILAAPHGAFAQTAGSIGGTIRDVSGAVLPRAEISVTQSETGLARQAVSDDQGLYAVTSLPVGTYELKACLLGFVSAVHKGIEITIGRSAIVDVVLQVGEISETVIVSGDAPQVDTKTSQVSGLVHAQQMEDLPLNGRDFTQLVAFQAGVATPPVSKGSLKLSISGGRPYQISFLQDGTDISRWDGRPGGVAGLTLGVEAIREFAVLTNSFTSEYGGTGVSLVSSVTKSGTNDVHGSGYYYMRNSALDARNYFDAPDEPIPAFRRHQFGGSFGGPIARNKAFVFGNYEGLRQSLGITSTLRVPSMNARLGLLADAKEPTKLRQVAVDPASAVWLKAFPSVNSSRSFGADIGEAIVASTQPTREDFFVIKVDYDFSAGDTVMARYTFDDSTQSTPSPAAIEGLATLNTARNQYVVLEHKHVAGPHLLNVLRFGVNRNNDVSAWAIPALSPEYSFLPGKPLGQLSVTGLTDIGVDTYRPNSWISNLFDLNDTVSWTRGAHSLKFGGQFKRTQVQTTVDLRFSGQMVFPNLEGFLTGKPQRFSGALPGSSSYRGYRRSYGALFVHDDWRLSRRLTLNFGARWEKMGNPTEVNGKVSTLRDVYSDATFTVGNPWFNIHSPLKGFSPRVGLSWDPFGLGKSVLRGGFGIFLEQVRENNYANARNSPPFVTDVVVTNPPWPSPLGGNVTIPALSPTVMEFNTKLPLTYQWNLLAQQEVVSGTVLTVGYLGSRSMHLGSVDCPNCAIPAIVNGRYYWAAGLKRPNPAFEYMRYLAMDADSNYHGMQVRVEKRYVSGLAVQGNFTFSKAIDNGAAQAGSELGGVGNIFTRPVEQDRRSEKSLSPFDIRRNLSINLSYQLPMGAGRRFAAGIPGVSRILLAGWRFNAIAQFLDGSPAPIYLNFNRSRSLQTRDIADRPDLTPGASNNPVLGDPSKYYDPTAFTLQPAGFAGNLGRNTLILPGYANLDVSLVRRFVTFRESAAELRAEVFNVMNRPNFAAPNLMPFLGSGAYNPSAGVIGETRSTSRQVQFALRFSF